MKNSTPNTDSTLPEKLDEIFQPLINNPSLTLTTTYWNEAKQELEALIALKVQEARIDELERIDGYAYGTDYGDYAQDRLSALHKIKGEIK